MDEEWKINVGLEQRKKEGKIISAEARYEKDGIETSISGNSHLDEKYTELKGRIGSTKFGGIELRGNIGKNIEGSIGLYGKLKHLPNYVSIGLGVLSGLDLYLSSQLVPEPYKTPASILMGIITVGIAKLFFNYLGRKMKTLKLK